MLAIYFVLIESQSNKNKDVKLEALERALHNLEARREENERVVEDQDWILDYKRSKSGAGQKNLYTSL